MIREIVLDRAACGAWFFPTEASAGARRILEDILNANVTLIEPCVWRYDMAELLRSAVIRRILNSARAKSALSLLCEIPARLYSPEFHEIGRALSDSLHNNLNIYDAEYLTLAETRGAELFTADKNLLRLSANSPLIKPARDYA